MTNMIQRIFFVFQFFEFSIRKLKVEKISHVWII